MPPRPAFLRRPPPAGAAALGLALALVQACGPPTLTTAQLVASTREAMPRCQGGDPAQCAVACVHGGPNASCQRACNADDAPSCLRLATRLEREVDAPDAETPPSPIAPPDAELVTDLYERACRKGLGEGCRSAGNRILNGRGPGKRGAARALELLRAGCQQHQDADSCCMMAQLNFRLAEGGMGDDYRDEARKWARLSERRGGTCPEPEPLPLTGH
jgi:hypothetical protein